MRMTTFSFKPSMQSTDFTFHGLGTEFVTEFTLSGSTLLSSKEYRS